MAKKRKERAQAPVPTGHDQRARERERHGGREEKPEAPDGVSGSWG